jgi:hypothetical protein
MIETFDNFYDLLHYLDHSGWDEHEYWKVEIFKTDDGRWRVGVITEQQYELKFEEQQS